VRGADGAPADDPHHDIRLDSLSDALMMPPSLALPLLTEYETREEESDSEDVAHDGDETRAQSIDEEI
jgi:hypothetical protein